MRFSEPKSVLLDWTVEELLGVPDREVLRVLESLVPICDFGADDVREILRRLGSDWTLVSGNGIP